MGIRLIKNKKAQIPAALTWVVAFLIVFFIVILFVSSTVILSINKKIDIGITEYNSETLESQRALIWVLNGETDYLGEKMKFKQLVAKWPLAGRDGQAEIREKLRQEIEWRIGGRGAYVFHADYGSGKAMEITNLGNAPQASGIKEDFLDKSAKIYVLSDDGKIKARLYIEK